MARIAKPGLEYFPLDIDFFQDIRIRKLIKRQGGKAVTIYTLLLCLIYKNGYYMQWDKELPFICAETSGFDEAYISEVIKTCLSLGLFDKNLFDSEKVITSKGIQLRYCHIQRINKRIGSIDKYSLIDKSRDTKPAPAPAPTNTKKTASAKPRPQTPKPQPQATDADTNPQWLDEFFADNHKESLLLLCKNLGLKYGEIDRLRSLANAIVAEWEISHTSHRDYNDWSRHLISCMRLKNKDTNALKQPTPPTPDEYSFGGGFGGQDT